MRVHGGRRGAAPAGGGPRCFICRDMMLHLDSVLGPALERVAEYDFASFSVGATMKPSVLDRDDRVRSAARARGSGSVKAALTRDLARAIARRHGATPDRTDPDITVVLDTRYGSCEVRSKRMAVRARYTKSRRGIPQRGRCGSCMGFGCGSCASGSIESMFSSFLLERVGGTGVRFTWVGGEDRSSLVGGGGRLLYARVQNPVRRNAALPETASYPGVEFTGISVADRLPRQIPRFRSTIRMRVEAELDVDAGALRTLKGLRGPVSVWDDSRRAAERTVYMVRYRRISGRAFTMTMEADGGLPVKRFVSGRGVEPSVSGALRTACACTRFDFADIRDGACG